MGKQLRLRVYNVLFGDALLLKIPDIDSAGNETDLHVLIDVGNALAGQAGRDEVFRPVLENIRDELDGAPLDLYVMTHEHMDHVQGLLFGAEKLGITFKARHVWMTASSEGDAYYQRFPRAKRRRIAALTAFETITTFLSKSALKPPPFVEALLGINNPRSSKDCVDHISGIGLDGAKPAYVHRGSNLDGHHPFNRTSVRLLAPEEDTSIYYGPLPPNTLAALVSDGAPTSIQGGPLTPPAGVSAGHFFDLVAFRAGGLMANLRQIDKAANNSSLVIELEWNGWHLLLPGDAEEKSWEVMDRAGSLGPVHFLKVSHHGSHNGTPHSQFEKILPPEVRDGRPRYAVVSTHEGAYQGVPDPATIALVGSRTNLVDTRSLPEGGWVDFMFPDSPQQQPSVDLGP